MNKTEIEICENRNAFEETSSPGRFSLALGAGRPAPKAREKRPGDEVVEEIFCLSSILSKDDIISAWRTGLKTGMDFRGLIWKRVWKMTFLLVWNRVRIWRTGAAHPHQEFPGVPPGTLTGNTSSFLVIEDIDNGQTEPSMSSQFLLYPGEGGGGETPSCHCWPGKVRITERFH